MRCSVLDFTGSELEMEASYGPVPEEDEKQMVFALADGILPEKSAKLRD